MARFDQERAEETVRTLAGAANALRLYPPTSHLPAEAIERFLAAASAAVGEGSTMQVVVEPKGFKYADALLAEGQANVSAFAESLYAHQVGRLIVAPGVDAKEVRVFLEAVASDPPAVKDAGGLRALLNRSSVSRLAVIEVTLRASTEAGLAGLDLTVAPLDEIAECMAPAAFKWQETAAAGTGIDEVDSAINSLEEAARDLVARRLGEALMRLDEDTRARTMAAALAMDANGEPMEGMLDVISHMKPAALARLLTLAAGMTGDSPDNLLGKLELPPEAMRLVAMLLTPSVQSDVARGVPAEADVDGMAETVAEEDEAEAADLERQIARSSPARAAGKALATTIELAEERHSEDAVLAIGDALAPAVRAGALAEVRQAITYLAQLSSDPALSAVAARAKQPLQDDELLRACIASLATGADADTVAAILSAAGRSGADAFISYYISAPDAMKPRLQQVLRGMGDVVVATVSRRIRDADSRTAKELIGVLVSIGDKRTVPILRQAMDHVDFQVRKATLVALADTGGPESESLLVQALNHWDPETRRVAAHEIGRAKAESAVPAMLRILQGYYLFERNYGLKKEVILSLEAIGSPAAEPTLRRMAKRRFVIGRKNRELQFLARRALKGLESA